MKNIFVCYIFLMKVNALNLQFIHSLLINLKNNKAFFSLKKKKPSIMNQKI